jgi:hypothetical protein
MKKNYLLVGGLVVAGLTTAYFLYKDKQNRRPVGIIDDEVVDFDFENATGSTVRGNAFADALAISVADYNKSVKETTTDKKLSKFLGRKIYTLKNNVKVRRGANVNNGFFNNIAGTIPKKKSFIGRVVSAQIGDDKRIWFGVNEENSNQLFDIKRHFSWDITKPIDTTLRWVRSDVVVVNMNRKKAR